MAFGYPSGTNTYVPNHAASQNLVVGFSRNPNEFPISSYTQYIRAKNNVGLWFQWLSQEAARITSDDDREHNWADGEAAPSGVGELEAGEWKSFTTIRKAWPYTLGQMAVDQATFSYLAAQGSVAAGKAMTSRTLLTYNALKNAAWGTNTADVDGTILTSGMNWSNGSVGFDTNNGPNIKLSFQYAEKVINLATIGAVRPNQLAFVCNPNTAQRMAASTEIQDYLKQSPVALAQLRGDVPSQNGKWGLPDTLYNHPVSVEDTVRISSRKGAATVSRGYVLADGEAYFLARQGQLEGIEGERSFSTVQIFFYKDELTVETKYDADNRRYLGRVVSNFVPQVVSVQSGFRFTNCFGAG